MADKKVQIDILADASNFQKGTAKASQSASTLEKALSKLGPVGKVAQGVLDKVGLTSLTSAAGIAGGITAAVGLSIAVVEKSIAAYVELGEKIRSYSLITGQSAEVSSRQVETFQALGVAEDVAAAAMFRLSRQSETGAEKLKAVGIEVVRSRDGTLDLNSTLLNVIKAYQGTSDAGEKAAIVFAAFGKAGATMIPILETNIAQLEELEKRVAKVYTEADLKRIRDYKIAQEELKQNQNELGINIGQLFLPAQQAYTDSMNESFYIQKRLAEAQQQGLIHGQNQARQVQNLTARFADEYRASLDAKQAIDGLAESQKDAAETARQEADAENRLYDSLHKSQDASFAYEQSLIDLKNAQDDVAKKGGNAAQESLRLREAYVRVADAAVALNEDLAEESGQTLSASQKADIFRTTLQNLAKKLGPNDPLRKALQEYIDKLHEIPHDISTNVSLTTQGFATHKAMSFDEGGIVPGPTGVAVPAIVHGGEEVVPVGGRGHGGIRDVHIHIDQGAYIDGPSLDRLSNMIAQRLTYVSGR